MARWRIRQFGAVRIEGEELAQGQGSEFATQRAAKILAILSLVRHGSMRREDLADALWPDDFYDATRLRLRKELSRLRQTLGPAAELLVTDGEALRLDRSSFDTDVEILRRAVALPEDAPYREARLREAAQACAGEFLPGWDDAWATAERSAAESLKCRLLVALGEVLLDRGEHEEALHTVREAIGGDPCHEGARMVAIRAHAALGSLTAAVSEFQQMKRLMREREGVAPSAQAEALLAQVQEGGAAVVASVARLPKIAVPLDRFFGRRGEMTQILSGLSLDGSTRLLTILGTGGIGKSRLAQEAALALRDAYGGQIAFVSLAESASPEAAAATLLAHLGWQGAAAADPVAVVASTLPPGPCLFVLDNLEHLLPAAATLVRRLLEACPSLRVLATSRKPLRLAGEACVPLGTLGDAAPAMLADLARSVRPDAADDLDLAELARRLDGIPLALRLVAPRLRVLGPSALLQRLGDRFKLLRSDAPDLPERHRSLRAVLDGCFEALGRRERTALLRMAPFRGGWTLDYLERIMPDEDGLEAMECLVDASLVTVDDEGASIRFGISETVREYLQGREGSDDARSAFARCVADELDARLPRVATPRSLALLDALDAEADNLHLATEAAIQVDPDVADRLLSRLWVYDATRGRHGDLERLYREFERRLPGRRLSAAAQFGRAMALAGLNRTVEAAEAFVEAERLYLADGRTAEAAFVAASGLASERRLARITFEETFARFERLSAQGRDEPTIFGRLCLMEGELLFYARRLEEAASKLDQARAIAEASGDAVGEISAVHRSGFVALDQGRYEEVRRSLAGIGKNVERLGDPAARGTQQELLGRAAFRLGEHGEALARFQNAREEWGRLGNRYQMADQDNSICRALLGLGRLDEARTSARSAFEGWRSGDDLGGVAVSLHSIAAILLAELDEERAGRALAAARRLKERHRLEFVLNEVEFAQSLARRASPDADPPESLDELFVSAPGLGRIDPYLLRPA